MSTERCDPEIYKRGRIVCSFHAAREVVERWVRKVAAESGQRVDWSYAAGRALVKFIGDRDQVADAVKKLLPELYNLGQADPWGVSQFRMHGEALPCPFCGCAETEIIEADDANEVTVQCVVCLGEGPLATLGCRTGVLVDGIDLEDEAVELWNKAKR